MEATKVRAIAMRVISERKEKERQRRKDIQTDMEHVYSFIKECADAGKFSCAFPINEISPKAEDELKRNGFKLKIMPSFGGDTIQVDWLGI